MQLWISVEEETQATARNFGRELTKRKRENKISRRTNKKKKLKKVKMLKKILQNNT